MAAETSLRGKPGAPSRNPAASRFQTLCPSESSCRSPLLATGPRSDLRGSFELVLATSQPCSRYRLDLQAPARLPTPSPAKAAVGGGAARAARAARGLVIKPWHLSQNLLMATPPPAPAPDASYL